jgi:hypothetical protein
MSDASRLLREAGWVLLGVSLGTTTCFALAGPPSSESIASAAGMANLIVFAMLMASLHRFPKPSRVQH